MSLRSVLADAYSRCDQCAGDPDIRGACDAHAQRCDDAILCASVIVLDGDKQIESNTGAVKVGAPPASLVHEALKHLDIAHIIYTSHSHLAEGKGSRYRVVVMPDRPLMSPSELHACVDWLINQLHEARVYLATVTENYGWSQPWYLPRLRYDKAPFEHYVHDGMEYLSVDACCAYYKRKIDTVEDQVSRVVEAPKQQVSNLPIGRYNAEHGSAESLLGYLEERSYAFVSTSRLNNEIAYRLRAPSSESGSAGVVTE